MVSQISQVTTMNVAISAIIAIFFPIILLIMWKRKTKAKLAPFFIGALIFIVFVLILESICHQFFLVKDSALSRFVNGNTWAYVLYAALAAGIFEETGRLLAFKLFLKKRTDKETAITYGIGHGGIESIILIGIVMLSSLIVIVTLNSMGGVEGYMAQYSAAGLPEETLEVLRTNMMSYYTTAPYIYLLSGVERIFTVIFHIALSVLVFVAAKRPGKLYLYPAAIGIHAFLDVFAVLYQKQIIKSMLLMEAIIMVITAATAYLAYRIYQKEE